MIVVRPIKLEDEEAYIKFAFTTHLGVTSLPKNNSTLHKKLLLSLESFQKNVKKPGYELYLFIIEDTKIGKQVGTANIWAKTAVNDPIYFFRIESIVQETNGLPLPPITRLIHPVCYHDGPAEIGGIYIFPEYRHGGYGRLLSLSRFLFIASFPQRFDQNILSNMRGYIDDHDNCLFWKEFGNKFLLLDFKEVMDLITRDRSFIPYFLPKYPVYVSLLSKEVQESIGKTHSNTIPALNMLLQEGFHRTDEIDIFDGGPILKAQTNEVRTVKESKTAPITKILPIKEGPTDFIVCNNSIDFRACLGHIENDESGVSISSDAAKALQVKEGNVIRYVLGR